MTRQIEQSSRFKRDLKREANGQHRQALQAGFVAILDDLANDRELSQRHRDHELIGDWSGFRECHIKPDLLLIYRKHDTEADRLLHLARLGSHSELFG
jgi:mRNA interferase YafQ